MTAKEEMEKKGLKVGDKVLLKGAFDGCFAIIRGFTPKRVLIENIGRPTVEGPQPYAPKNIMPI
mgnify:FL=1|tara:strand:+ start:917 stop:1108 length:192 start_codon:yes stop_codon:yes gene_type:complete